MFEVLVESAAHRTPTSGARTLAISAHLTALLAATLGRGSAPATILPPRLVPIPLYVAAAARHSGTTPGSTMTPGVATGPSIPIISVTVPSTIPIVTPILGRPEPGITPRSLIGADSAGLTPPTLGTGAVMLAAEVDEPATVLTPFPPVYPRLLAAARITGRVTIVFVVDTLGRCEAGSLRILGATHPGFEDAAKASVSGTLYRPALSKGRRVRQLVQQSVSFRME